MMWRARDRDDALRGTSPEEETLPTPPELMFVTLVELVGKALFRSFNM